MTKYLYIGIIIISIIFILFLLFNKNTETFNNFNENIYVDIYNKIFTNINNDTYNDKIIFTYDNKIFKVEFYTIYELNNLSNPNIFFSKLYIKMSNDEYVDISNLILVKDSFDSNLINYKIIEDILPNNIVITKIKNLNKNIKITKYEKTSKGYNNIIYKFNINRSDDFLILDNENI
jgi:hypothetical protein